MNIYIFEKGRWSELGYRASAWLLKPSSPFESSEELAKPFRCSTWPNPFSPKKPEIRLDKYAGAIAPGIYDYCFGYHNGKPALTINDEDFIPTICPNPNQNGEWHANHVDMHIGWSVTWRGSLACITFHPKDWAPFFSYFDKNSIGKIAIEREHNDIS